MKEDIGKRISELRKSMNMNKEQFSKLIGFSGQYLGTVEAGVNGLSLTSLISLCEKNKYICRLHIVREEKHNRREHYKRFW